MNTLPEWPGDETGVEMYRESSISNYHARLEDPIKAFFDGAKMGYSRKFAKQMSEDPKKMIHGLFFSFVINVKNDLPQSHEVFLMDKDFLFNPFRVVNFDTLFTPHFVW